MTESSYDGADLSLPFDDWLVMGSGTYTPITPSMGPSYLLHFYLDGDITLSVGGVELSIDRSTGTLTCGSVSASIPKTADLDPTAAPTRVLVRVTPSWVSIATSDTVSFGTSDSDENLGMILTEDFVSEPEGMITISGSGKIYAAGIQSAFVWIGDKYIGCNTEELNPRPYNVFLALLKNDPATYFAMRHENNPSEPLTDGEAFWPDVTIDDSVEVTGGGPTYDSFTNSTCEWSRTKTPVGHASRTQMTKWQPASPVSTGQATNCTNTAGTALYSLPSRVVGSADDHSISYAIIFATYPLSLEEWESTLTTHDYPEQTYNSSGSRYVTDADGLLSTFPEQNYRQRVQGYADYSYPLATAGDNYPKPVARLGALASDGVSYDLESIPVNDLLDGATVSGTAITDHVAVVGLDWTWEF
ncbi:hypothetical protein LOC67_23340 [Stieleria sp. JC731]|nr:hypothetical protein [Stieleria sp. JC731]MCC9603494.1 hypothetical protein [Stieleria sp. JC731]